MGADDSGKIVALSGGVNAPNKIKDANSEIPVKFSLSQNYPNPFNPVTDIEYDVSRSGKYRIIVYNILGQKIRTLVNSNLIAATYTVQWNGLDDAGQQVPSGIYFYVLRGRDVNLTRKMILMR